MDNKRETLYTSAFIIIFLIGLALRLAKIWTLPVQTDEGFYAYVSYLYTRMGGYQYTFAMHGPFLYNIAMGMFILFGDHIAVARIMPAIFGSVSILLFYPLKDYLGKPGSIVTSLLFATSPLFVFYSQLLMAESFAIFFILATFVCAVWYFDKKQDRYMILGAISFAMALCTKEEVLLTFFILLMFFIIHHTYRSTKKTDTGLSIKHLLGEVHDFINKNREPIALSSIITVAICISFYSSFFTFPEGLGVALFETAPTMMWVITTTPAELSQPSPPHYYLSILLTSHLLVFFLAMICCISTIFGKRKRFNLLIIFWMITSLVIYSAAPYKIIWHILYPLLPFTIAAGLGSNDLIRYFRNSPANKKKKWGAAVVSIIIVFMGLLYIVSLEQALDMDDHNIECKHMAEYIDENTNHSVGIHIITSGPGWRYLPWPLPWYLRERNMTYTLIPPPEDKRTELLRDYRYPVIIVDGFYESDMDYLLDMGYNKTPFDKPAFTAYLPNPTYAPQSYNQVEQD